MVCIAFYGAKHWCFLGQGQTDMPAGRKWNRFQIMINEDVPCAVFKATMDGHFDKGSQHAPLYGNAPTEAQIYGK